MFFVLSIAEESLILFFVLGYIIFGKVFGKIERRPHDMFLVLLFRALHSFLSIHLLSLENL